MVRLGGEHGLDIMLAVTHDKSISVSSLGRRSHLLNLEALHDGDWEELGGLVGVSKDGPW